MAPIEIPAASLPVYMLTLARVGGVASFAPFFGSPTVSIPIRIVLAVSLSFALFPLAEASMASAPADILTFGLLLIRELLVGIWLALVVRLVFAATEIAGEAMGFQMGFGFIQIVDPQTEVESPFLGLFLNLIAILLFLGMNGHHWVIQALADSYQVAPEPVLVSGALAEQIVKSSGYMFVLGFRLAAPILVMLFIADILIGLLGRTAPQIQVLIMGLPAKIIVGFAVLNAIVYSFVPFLATHLGKIGTELTDYVGLLGG